MCEKLAGPFREAKYSGLIEGIGKKPKKGGRFSMVRSMYAGVTGLSSHQTKMDVIGNNVSNVNTVGFKSGRVLFNEVFNQTLSPARAPGQGSESGGVNPKQVGLGIDVSSIDTIMSRGSIERTDNVTDLSIDGDGFFVTGGETEDMREFTRAGNFSIDKNGDLIAGNGKKVYGWNDYQDDPEDGVIFNTDQDISPLNIYLDEHSGNKRVTSSSMTQRAMLSGNLNAGEEVMEDGAIDDPEENAHYTSPFTAYDTLGNEYRVNLEYFKVDVDEDHTEWQVRVSAIDDGQEGDEIEIEPEILEDSIKFDKSGSIKEDSNSKQKINITPGEGVGADEMEIELDFSSLTMYDGESTVRSDFVDGNRMGNLTSFEVGEDGIITGVYDNGEQMPLGQVALANFDNPEGLSKTGENSFIETANSGEFVRPLKPGEGGSGKLTAGTLEMSNVDLSKEFADMIVTQRGFQANSRIITSADEMLQELINLKR